MKKRITLLIAVALLAIIGAQAKMVKTVEFKFTDTDFAVSYTGTNSVNTETGELSLGGNATCAWDRYYSATKFDLSSSINFVVKLKEAATQDLFVVLSTNGFWGTVGEDGTGYIGTLAAGQTELSIPLSGLKNNQEGKTKYGETIDLTKINMINLWTGGGGGAYTYKIDEIYAEAYAETYDEVIETKVWDKTSFSWTGENEAKAEWGGENMTIDKTNKKITKTNGAWEGNNAVAWLNYVATDISGYDRLVLELDEASSGPVEVVVSDAGFWGGKCHSAILPAGKTELVLTLSELKITGTPGSEDTWKKDDPLDLENVNLIFIRTDNGTANQVIDVKDFYFANSAPSEYSLIRENTKSGKYGTICLPFAASKPDNANVYDVVGWDESNVYLSEESVKSLEAGKAYMFESTDANDITFTKTGTEENLTEPAASTNMLHGQFKGSAPVPANSYILKDDKWKKVKEGNKNTVKNYRAYLKLSDDLKVTTSVGARKMNFVEGRITGIEEVSSFKFQVSSTDIYDLQGHRVSQPTKPGIYVKNGKKIVIN